MRVPKTLESLAEQGIVQEVIRPLMSGKEAQIYLVVCQGQICAAKVYKEAQNRSFKNRADYMEGRKVRNTRDQRAMKKGSAYGRSKDEESWRTTEVDMIYRLHAAGVRVPTPHTFVDGVLIMELVKDANGNPAPRLGDLDYSAEEAIEIYHHLLREVIRMLCAGVVHGDLSDFNVLLSADGPVVIDFPQSINAASNQNARTLLLRDVANLHRFVTRFAPGTRRQPYGEEMWKLYENNQLTPETQLTGRHQQATARVDTRAVLDLISDANQEEDDRRQRSGLAPATPARGTRPRIIEITPAKPQPRGPRPPSRGGGGGVRSPQQGAGSGVRPPYQGARPAPRQGDGNGTRPPHQSAAPFARKPSTKPKRGDSAQASTYVSPAARKDAFSLTPRDDTNDNLNSPNTTSAETTSAKPRRRRRNRGGNGNSPANPTQTAPATPPPNGAGRNPNFGAARNGPNANRPREPRQSATSPRTEQASNNSAAQGGAPRRRRRRRGAA